MKQQSNTIKYTFLYSLIQGMFWIDFAIIMGFASLYLLDRGLTNGQIGIIIGIAGITSAIVQPLVAGYADRSSAKSIKWIVSTILIAAIVISAGMTALHGKNAMLSGIIFGLCIAILQFILPFVNSLGTETISQGISLNWGFARGIGSAAYAVVSPLIGIIVSKIGTLSVPIAVTAGYITLFLCVLAFPFRKTNTSHKTDSRETAKKTSSSVLAFLRKYPKFSLLLIGLTCAYISHVILNTFMFQIINSKGGGSVEMGAVMAFCAVIELPALFFYSFFQKKAGSDVWLRVSTIFMALKAVGTFFAISMKMFYAVQIFQALGWALISIAPVYYVRSVIAPEDAIKGQAYVTMTYTAGSVLASVIGGGLLDIGGVFALLLFAAIASVIGCVFTILFTERNI